MKELTKLSPELEGNITNFENMIFVVSDNESRENMVAVGRSVKTIRAKIVEFFEESRRSAHKTWKAICANESTFTDRLDAVEKKAKRVVTKYDDEQDVIRERERARLQAIEDAKARKEQERLMKQAEKIQTPERSEALMEEAANIIAPVVQVEEKEKSKGESTRKIWKSRVIDINKVPRVFMVVDEKALNAYAKATKGVVPVEGIEFYQESSLAITI